MRDSHLAQDEHREAILKAVKERVRQSEERQLTQMITDAIGERRTRDLEDLIFQIEQDRGWSIALKHLVQSRYTPYRLPVGAGPSRTQIEDLKYRETIFSLLGCSGFEPVPLTSDEILSILEKSESLVDASRSFLSECKLLTRKQIESGDTLFYNTNLDDSNLPQDILQVIEESQQLSVTKLVLLRNNNQVNVLPLWYTELGRQVLSELGIKGSQIDSETFDIVISVLQHQIQTTTSQDKVISSSISGYPTNPIYRTLLTSIINHEVESLINYSSRHSSPTLKFLLKDTLDQYEKQQSSDIFRNLLSLVNAHVRVRNPYSIVLLEELAYSKDIRIATTAITALGNFYNEPAASVLVDLLCTTKNKEVTEIVMRAIRNISKNCFETRYVVRQAVESESCTNLVYLKRLHKEIWKEKHGYYL